MASSSSASIQKSFAYDVFLSFRGEDTRTVFIDQLYTALQQKRIYTYKDDEAIRKGKKISDELIRSIDDSEFYIIVFSKNYASSSWCLDELVRIMECHNTTAHTAYPVFYDVEPMEVRKQIGAVGEAFAKHKNDEAAPKWKEALKEAANLAGWELKNTTNGSKAKFIQSIVEEISSKQHSIHFNVDEKLVGMETRIKDVLSSLERGIDDVRIIGIKGMGGGGKTTLARAVFDEISFQFEAKSFVENVREVSNTSLSGLKSLQNQVLKDVLFDRGINISSVHEGKNMMKRRMCGRKVLIVLDDVDHIEQLEALAGERSWFKQGSRIIITTRDEQLLVAHKVKLIIDVNLLSSEEAICLFSNYAFGGETALQGYEELCGQVVRYAAGLPLTLKVLGSFLCGKNKSEWIDALERLKSIPLQETLKKLELSYVSLEDDYKEIFLDVACILKGWSKDLIIEALESCGFHARNGLRVLQQKSLITIKGSHGSEYVGMHDHIEEMGKNIVRRSDPYKPNKHSRLWICEEIENILAKDLGTKAIRCIQFHSQKVQSEILTKGFKNMKELRSLFVILENNSFYSTQNFDNVGQYLPNALRFAYWPRYPFMSLPKTFQADNLVSLKMVDSKIVQLWEGGEKKVLNKLKFLDLSHSKLTTLNLGLIPNLEVLSLRGCRDLVKLHMLDGCLNLISVDLSRSKLTTIDLRSAMNLKLLDLSDCYAMVELHLPDRCLKLTYLNCTRSKLKTLDLGRTPNLKKLELEECSSLVQLQVPIGCLENIVYLVLSGCLRFTSFLFDKKKDASRRRHELLEVDPLAELHLIAKSLKTCPLHPESTLRKFQFQCFYKDYAPLTRNLETLISVGLCACTNLEMFSERICALRHLRTLRLECYPEAPKEIDQLDLLEELCLSTTNMKHLPDSICMLKHLKILKLESCWRLEKLPEDLGQLKCLTKLTLSSANIKHIPDSICMLKHLVSLNLRDCFLIENLPEDLGRLECLEELCLSFTKTKHLPDSICMLKHLKILVLFRCSLLEKLPENLGLLKRLVKLDLSSSKIKHLPDTICMLKNLTSLDLNHCSLLEKLPKNLDRLECLEWLDLSECKILRDIPLSICKLKCLDRLDVGGTCISRLPQNICLMKGLRISGSRRLLESCGFKSEIRTFQYEDTCCVDVLMPQDGSMLVSTSVRHYPG